MWQEIGQLLSCLLALGSAWWTESTSYKVLQRLLRRYHFIKVEKQMAKPIFKEKIDTVSMPKTYLRNTLFRMLTEYGEYQDAREKLELQIEVLEDAGNTILKSIKELESLLYGYRPWDEGKTKKEKFSLDFEPQPPEEFVQEYAPNNGAGFEDANNAIAEQAAQNQTPIPEALQPHPIAPTVQNLGALAQAVGVAQGQLGVNQPMWFINP